MDSVPSEKAAMELYSQLSQLWKSATRYGMLESGCQTSLKCYSLFHLRIVPQKWILTEVNYRLLKHWESCGAPWKMYSSFKLIDLLRSMNTPNVAFYTRWQPCLTLWACCPLTQCVLRFYFKRYGQAVCPETNWWTKTSRVRLRGGLKNVQIPWCLKATATVREVTLHTFVDASQEANGAASYTRHLYEDGMVSCCLVVSKSRVSPLQAVNIPRLELMAAVVGLKLSQALSKAPGIKKEEWIFWSNSMDVMYWIRGQTRKFKPFVANHVGEIQASTNPEQWRYVRTKQNPADLLTRALSVSDLSELERWWKGLSFLEQDSSEWPPTRIEHEKPMLSSRSWARQKSGQGKRCSFHWLLTTATKILKLD